MPLKRLIPTVAVAAFLAGGLAFAAVAAPAFHLGASSTAAEGATGTPSRNPSASARATKAQAACDAFLADFAKQLGVTPDKVKTSLKVAINSAIDAAVKRGDMTADQATKAKARADAAKGCQGLPAFPGRFGARPGAGIAGLRGIVSAAATALGVTPAELRTAIMSGKTLHDVAGTKMTKDEFIANFKTALAAAIEPQVTASKITADQAKTRVDRAATMAGKLWDTSLMGGAGAFGHAGGFGRFRAPAPGAAPPGAGIQ